MRLTQEELADKVGVSKSAIAKWETDGGLPDRDNLRRIADVMGVSVDELHNALAAIPVMENIQYVDLGNYRDGITYDDLAVISRACPNAVIALQTEVYGKDFNLADTVLDLNHINVDDNAASLMALLPYMKNLAGLDMDGCGVPDEIMAQIRDDGASGLAQITVCVPM